MRRLLGITLAIATLGTTAFAAESKSALNQSAISIDAGAAPQWQRDRGGRDRNDRRRYERPRSVTRTRVVRVGRRVYRETYVVRYLPTGRTDTRLISRVRIS